MVSPDRRNFPVPAEPKGRQTSIMHRSSPIVWAHPRIVRYTDVTSRAHRRLHDRPELRDRTGVFAGRAEAGSTLARMLEAYRNSDAIVMAIPAGGVPVGAVIARELDLGLDVAVVSKITPSWNSEVGYGAVAFDGTVRLNEELLAGFGLSRREIEQGIAATNRKVQQRVRLFRGDRPLPDVTNRTTILVDDGLASGFTMQVAAEALRNGGASKILVAVPTAHGQAIRRLTDHVEAIYCANVRGGWSFAVADAYRQWSDVGEDDAAGILKAFAGSSRAGEG